VRRFSLFAVLIGLAAVAAGAAPATADAAAPSARTVTEPLVTRMVSPAGASTGADAQDAAVRSAAAAGAGAGTAARSTAGTAAGTAALTAAAARRPVIDSVTPAAGPAKGGAAVTIRGSRFTSVRRVTIGGARASRVRVRSARVLTAVTPKHAAGPAMVSVSTKFGTSKASKAAAYRYVNPPRLTAMSAHSGPVTGGQRITISGRNLSYLRTVDFGRLAAKVLPHSTSTRLLVDTPASWAGSVRVIVTTAGGNTPVTAADKFAFKNPAPVTSSTLTPASGAAVATGADVTAVSGGQATTSASGPGQAPWVVTLAAGAAVPAVGQPYLLEPGSAVFPSGLAGTVSAVDTSGSPATITVSPGPGALAAAVDSLQVDFSGPLSDADATSPSAAASSPVVIPLSPASLHSPARLHSPASLHSGASPRAAASGVTGSVDFGSIAASALQCSNGKLSAEVSGSISLKLEDVEDHFEVDAGSLWDKPFIDIWISYQPVLTFSLTAAGKAECSLPAAWQNSHQKVFPIGDTGAVVAIAPDVTFSVSAGGTIDVTQHSYRMMGFITNPDGSIQRLDGQSEDPAQVSASGQLEVQAFGGVQIQVGELDVVGVGMSVGAGVTGTAEVDTKPAQVCVSLTPFLQGTLYAYLNVWVTEWKLQAFELDIHLGKLAACLPLSKTPKPNPEPLEIGGDLPDGTVGEAYTGAVTATGGVTPYAFTLTSGSLPPGLSLGSAGDITGTPEQVGSDTFTVTVADSGHNSAQGTFTIDVVSGSGGGSSPPDLGNVETLVGTVTVPYSYQLPSSDVATADPLYWAVASGSPPPGVQFQFSDSCGGECPQYSFAGTPTQSGSWDLTMTVTDAGGTATVPITLTISAQPTSSPYTQTQAYSLSQYTFSDVLSSDGTWSIIRTDTQTGATVDVLAAGNAPAACTTDGTADYETSSADGNFVGIGCSDGPGNDPYQHLYEVDISAGTTHQVDVPNPDAPSPVQYTADFNEGYSSTTEFAQNGISDDGSEVLFISGAELTANSVTEAQTFDHLYVRDMTTGTTALISSPPGDGEYIVFRTASLSGDGTYVDDLGMDCSGPDGGYCGGVYNEVVYSPFAPASTTAACDPSCSRGEYAAIGGPELSTTTDGLTMSYLETYWTLLPDGSYQQNSQTVVWDAATGAVADMPNVSSALLAGDGSEIFYSTDFTLFTCEMAESSLDSQGNLGPPVVVGDPPQSLPRTGCSGPIATNSDGSELLFGSSSTNLVPDPGFAESYDEYANYLVNL